MITPDDGTAVGAGQARSIPADRQRRFLRWFRRRRVPYVQQNTSADCGIASVAMVLGWFGRRVRLGELRNALDPGRDGNNASDLMELAREYGLDGHGVKLDVADLDRLPPAAILHMDFNHFVVFEGHDRRGARVVDPAFGRRKIGYEEFGRRFTGVALVFNRTDAFTPGGRSTSPVRHYVRQVLTRSGMLLRIFSLSALLQVIGLGLPILTGLLVDRIIPTGNIGTMQILAIGFFGLIGFHFLTTFLRSYLLLYLRTELDARMTLDFLEHLFELPFSFFQTRSAGDLMMRLNSNAAVREIITSSALSGALDGFMVVSYLVVLLLISPLLGGLVVLLGLLRVVVYLASRHRIRELMTENLAKEALSQDYQVQIFAGVETLKAAGAEPRALQHWRHLFYDVLNVNVLRGRLDALIQSLIGALSFGSPLVILLVGGHQVIVGNLSLGTMLALSALSAGFLAPLASLVNMGLALERLGSFVDRLEDVLSTSREQNPEEVTPASRLNGRIRVDDVTFRYHKKSAPAVRDVSAEIEPGELVAIVGRTAAGKTTLAYLLLGLYRPTHGRILFDGRDLTSLEARSVRSQLGVVTQHPYMFSGTIRDNIALTDPDLPMDRIERAASLAHIHDEIAAMPMQYNTTLAGGGQSLSGGQRQRIALARALAQEPAILLLDEATSAVDAETERKIQSSLAGIGCTRIVVAHRLSTVRRAGQILVLDEGRLVERGTHDELIAAKGTYYRLVRAQASNGNDD